MKHTLQIGGYRVELDLAPQVLGVSIPPEYSFGEERRSEARLTPTLTWEKGFVSASMMAQKAKLFDDGLLAAVELAAQAGGGRFPGKAAMLRNIIRLLLAREPNPSRSLAILLGAARLGDLGLDPPSHLESAVTEMIEEFLGDPLLSKPVGFYTWTPELSRIFQQDRLLQQPLQDPDGILVLARALNEAAGARTAYDSYLQLVSRLTNPLIGEKPDLRGLLERLDRGETGPVHEDLRFLPPSKAHETELVKRLYGDRPIPEGFDLIEEMVRRIRAGALSLEPGPDSGWYDYQTWALEPLVVPEKMPEAQKLKLDPEYRKQLLELFKGVLALTRETHIKQLEMPLAGVAMKPEPALTIEPQLSVEPTFSYYLRRAVAYRFVESVLKESLGAEELERMRRLTAEGPVALSLRDELRQVSALFYGASAVLAAELGLSPGAERLTLRDMGALGSGNGKDADSEAFLSWARAGGDLDLSRDVRMMVPVFYDIERRQTKVWVFLGWSSRRAVLYFARPPAHTVFDGSNRDVTSRLQIEFGSRSLDLPYPVFGEVYVTRILNREEFRRHCDRHGTREAILKSLA